MKGMSLVKLRSFHLALVLLLLFTSKLHVSIVVRFKPTLPRWKESRTQTIRVISMLNGLNVSSETFRKDLD